MIFFSPGLGGRGVGVGGALVGRRALLGSLLETALARHALGLLELLVSLLGESVDPGSSAGGDVLQGVLAPLVGDDGT